MPVREIHVEVATASGILPVNATTTKTGSTVDTAGYEACEIMFHIGVRGDTWDATNYIELEVTEGAASDGTDKAAVANVSLTNNESATTTNTGTIKKLSTATAGSQIYRAGYLPATSKRYITPIARLTGTHTTGTPISCTVILGKPHIAPTANPS